MSARKASGLPRSIEEIDRYAEALGMDVQAGRLLGRAGLALRELLRGDDDRACEVLAKLDGADLQRLEGTVASLSAHVSCLREAHIVLAVLDAEQQTGQPALTEVVTEGATRLAATATSGVDAAEVTVILDAKHTEAAPRPDGTWTVAVQVPISLPVEMRHDLFSAVAAAVNGWEPDDRDGWDADVSGYPAVTFDRCPSCDHLASMHQPDGCWHTVTHGTENQNKVCPCSMPRPTLNQPQEA